MSSLSPSKRSADCAVCGARCSRTPAGGWRHMRPQPDGSPHDHSAKPAKDNR